MHHPALGLPPDDPTAGLPAAAARLRANRARLARVALQETIRLVPGFDELYDERMLRLMLRDYDGHIEQLARALETGEDGKATLDIIFAAYESAGTGRKVTLPFTPPAGKRPIELWLR